MRFIVSILIVMCMTLSTQAQTRVVTSFSQTTGETAGTTWVLHGSSQYQTEVALAIPLIPQWAGRVDLNGRASLGYTREGDEGDYSEVINRISGEWTYTGYGKQGLDAYTSVGIVSEILANDGDEMNMIGYGSDYTLTSAMGLSRSVAAGHTLIHGRFGGAYERYRAKDMSGGEFGIESMLMFLVPLSKQSSISSKTNTFRSSEVFTLQSYNTLQVRLSHNLALNIDANLIKLRERDWASELQVGLGYVFG